MPNWDSSRPGFPGGPHIRKAKIRSELTSKNSKTKKETSHGEETGRINVVTPKGEYVAIVKVSNGFTLASGYQSVRMDVGVELPWGVRLGNTKDLRAGFEKAYDFLDRETAKRAKDMDELLQELIRKYR